MVGLSTSGRPNYRTKGIDSINKLRISVVFKSFEKKTRSCLKCDEKFISEGQRLCKYCRFENNICYLDTFSIKKDHKNL